MIEVQRRTTDGGTLEADIDIQYDAYGNRLIKIVDENGDGDVDYRERYGLDGWNSAKLSPLGNENWDVWADLNGGYNLKTRYLRGDVVDQLFARIKNNGDAFWYFADHLGSLRDITNNSGVVKDSLTYDGFGNITAETDSSFRGRYAWTGREFDVETDLQYNRARYYDAATGRWISEDPLGFDAGDGNLYRYVKNNSVIALDPSGLQEGQWLVENYGPWVTLGMKLEGKHIPFVPFLTDGGRVWFNVLDKLSPRKEPSAEELDLMKADYPGWKFLLSKNTLANGSIEIKHYEARISPKGGGAGLTIGAKYNVIGNNPKNTKWIQVVRSSYGKLSIQGKKFFVDARKKSPYYPSELPDLYDAPSGLGPQLKIVGVAQFFHAASFVVEEKAPKVVTIWQGFSWGFTLTSCPLLVRPLS